MAVNRVGCSSCEMWAIGLSVPDDYICRKPPVAAQLRLHGSVGFAKEYLGAESNVDEILGKWSYQSSTR